VIDHTDFSSAGGLVALGLGHMGWSVAECITHFESLCRDIFTPWAGAGLPLIGTLVQEFHHSKYQTQPMERALKEVFSENRLLFGGLQEKSPGFGSRSRTVNVAVVATSVVCNKAFVLSNYNRPADTDFPGTYPQGPRNVLGPWSLPRHYLLDSRGQLSLSTARENIPRTQNLGGVSHS
jgi:hypothetical protein